MPGRYVVGQDGVIAFAEVNPDYTHRPEPSDLLPVLDQLARARPTDRVDAVGRTCSRLPPYPRDTKSDVPGISQPQLKMENCYVQI